jgi:hypothetical protein
MLLEMPKADGGDAQRTRFKKGTESPPTLKEAGIGKKLSSRAQIIAKAIWILHNQFGRRNLAPYTKVELALKLDPLLRQRSKENQRGGQGGVLLKHKSAEANTRSELAIRQRQESRVSVFGRALLRMARLCARRREVQAPGSYPEGRGGLTGGHWCHVVCHLEFPAKCQ